MVDRLRGFQDFTRRKRNRFLNPMQDFMSLLRSGDSDDVFRTLGKPRDLGIKFRDVHRGVGSKFLRGENPYLSLMDSIQSGDVDIPRRKAGDARNQTDFSSTFNRAGESGQAEGSEFIHRWGRNRPEFDEDAMGDMMGMFGDFDIIGDPKYARGLEGTRQWNSLIQRAAKESGVPWQVIAAIMGLESGGNSRGHSAAGAVGLMQVMPKYWQSTANRFGGNLWDPYTNIRTGAEILKQNYDKWGSWDLAARAYLAGNPFSTAQDAYGTGVDTYSRIFNANLAALGWGQTQNNPQGQGNFRTSGNSVWNITGGQQFRITQGYGHTAFAASSGAYANNFHDGIDLGIPSGTRLNAGVQGQVIYAGNQGGYGGTVKVRTADGHIVKLSHLKQINVRVGQQVGAGQMVGLSGGGANDPMRGFSTGAHLHLTVYNPRGQVIDPRSYFRF